MELIDNNPISSYDYASVMVGMALKLFIDDHTKKAEESYDYWLKLNKEYEQCIKYNNESSIIENIKSKMERAFYYYNYRLSLVKELELNIKKLGDKDNTNESFDNILDIFDKLSELG